MTPRLRTIFDRVEAEKPNDKHKGQKPHRPGPRDGNCDPAHSV